MKPQSLSSVKSKVIMRGIRMDNKYRVELAIPLSGEAHTLASVIIPEEVEIVQISVKGSDLPYASFVRMIVTVEGEIVYMGSLRRKDIHIEVEDNQQVGGHRVLMVLASVETETPDHVKDTLGIWGGEVDMELEGKYRLSAPVGAPAPELDNQSEFREEFAERWA